MINVGEIVVSENFAQDFTVYRQTGSWKNSRWIAGPELTIAMRGTITARNPNDLDQVPEGDRVTGLMCFYTMEQLNTTNPSGTSDQIVWKGDRYRVSSSMPWGDFGYYKTFGVRMVST